MNFSWALSFSAMLWQGVHMKPLGWRPLLGTSSCTKDKAQSNLGGFALVGRIVDVPRSRAAIAEATGASATAALAVSALAIAGLAVGFFVIGRLIIREMLVKQAHLRHLKIDQLDVEDLRVGKLTVVEEERGDSGRIST
jgi:hypothetical protein